MDKKVAELLGFANDARTVSYFGNAVQICLLDNPPWIQAVLLAMYLDAGN